VTAEALQVARDALLESGNIAAVLAIARTMALERFARGLPVAWVGPVDASSRVLHIWWAALLDVRTGDTWAIWRDGRMLTTADRTNIRWSARQVRFRLERAVAWLNDDVAV
jgi:hypothetical protein